MFGYGGKKTVVEKNIQNLRIFFSVFNNKDLNAVEIENGIDIIEIYEENNQIYHFNIDS